MNTRERIFFTVIIVFLLVGPAVLVGMGLPDVDAWNEVTGVAVGAAWIAHWCWELATVWSGYGDRRREQENHPGTYQ